MSTLMPERTEIQNILADHIERDHALDRLMELIDPQADTETSHQGSPVTGQVRQLARLRAARARYAIRTSDGLAAVRVCNKSLVST